MPAVATSSSRGASILVVSCLPTEKCEELKDGLQQRIIAVGFSSSLFIVRPSIPLLNGSIIIVSYSNSV